MISGSVRARFLSYFSSFEAVVRQDRVEY